jgi:hypothetical protein
MIEEGKPAPDCERKHDSFREYVRMPDVTIRVARP